MQLSGKVIVVTGAGSGIGRELALQICARGAVVAGVDYQPESLAATGAMVLARGGKMSEHVVDVSIRDQVAALPASVLAEHEVVDGIINNAGIIHAHETIELLPPEQVERVFNINWWGTYYLVMAFLPHLRQRPMASIVNMSSMGGYMPFPGQVAYGASKAAVKLLTEGLRVELKRDSNIEVAVVYPGAVSTGITDNSPDISDDFKEKVREQTKTRDIGLSAAAAATRILHGMERGQSRILVGKDSWIIDKLYRLMPGATASLMSWIMEKAIGDKMKEQHG
jgi:NAD(P)-dependent dehydrogenase (short-subunit alcohol dehydrogenase family)